MASTPGLQMAGYTAMPSYSPASDEGLVSTTELVSERGYVPSPRRMMPRRSSIDSLDPKALRSLRRDRKRQQSKGRRRHHDAPDLLFNYTSGRRVEDIRCRFCRKVMHSRKAKRGLLMTAVAIFGVAVVFALFLLLSTHPTPVQSAYKVSTPYGPVQGFTDGISALFLGIPYAQPPTDGLRFAPPVAPKPWHDGMVYGMYPGPACPQGAAWGYNITMWEEDCLFISIYSPPSARLNLYHNVTPDVGTLRPVAVFLHGGGFIAGSGHQTIYNASQFARVSDTVVVTVNYRLGVFGFAALAGLVEQQGTSGNYGLLDQQQALKFVKEVIHAFGGDPARVTLWGQGAGGASALLHMSLQGSAGLFSQVISESGPIDASLPSLASACNATRELAVSLGCPLSPQLDTVACLRRTNWNRIVRASWRPELRTRWMPVLDGFYFPTTANAGIVSGTAANTVRSVMLGSNGNDATAILYWLLGGIRNGVSKPVAMMLLHQWFAGNATVVNAVWHRYGPAFSEANFTQNFEALSQIVSDGAYHCRAFTMARSLARATIPTYVYKFTHHLSFTPALFMASHFMELPFVFNKPCFVDCSYSRGTFTASEKALVRRMQSRWGSMMGGGVPDAGASFDSPEWPAFTPKSASGLDGSFFNLASSATVPSQTFAEEDVCGFWNTLQAPFGNQLWLFD